MARDRAIRAPATRAGLSVGRREVAAMAAGSLLYAALSWSTDVFHMEAAADVQIRPGVAVPIFFGFVYGPIVGFVVGALGNLAGDLASGLLPYPAAVPLGNPVTDGLRAYLANWQIGNGLMGLIPGVAALFYRRFFTLNDQLRALAFTVLAVVVGIGFAAIGHVAVDPAVSLDVAITQYFLPVARVNLLNAAIIVPVLLFNYARFDVGSTDWIRSGLMRRLLTAILVSAALPAALLGLFLAQQSAGAPANATESMAKVAFTVLLSLLFSLANAGLAAQSVTRPLLRLTEAARLMEAGLLDRTRAGELQAIEGADELSRLGHVFGRMALEVIGREEKLREQVAQLRIEIDQVKKAKDVEEVTGTEYFRHLHERARRMRERNVQQG